MIYFVSGFMRTGTKMMMQCGERGGMDAVYNRKRDLLNRIHGDEYYQPNEDGLYELDHTQYHQDGFPGMYEGKLIKMLSGGISGLYRVIAGDYKVVFMLRDFEEIRQSYEAFFENELLVTEQEYQQRTDWALGILYQRRDFEVTELWYRDVIEKPLETFEHLASIGWPLDPVKAAANVKPELCRFKLELLTVGI